MVNVDTVILGAGISGLATAAHLGRGSDLIILERDDGIGGYCKTVKRDGFVWDYSGHFFHFKHPQIEAYLKARMPGQEVRTVRKRSFVSYKGHWVDFPFQKNIHQLEKEEFIDCLHDLYLAATAPAPAAGPASFKDMLYRRLGRSITEKFLVPYNEKLYATDLSRLDPDAMGRFFPHADLGAIIRNMRTPDNRSYNDTFTYPAGGAIEYVNALASEVDPRAIHLSEPARRIDVERKVVETDRGEYRFRHLVSSAPLPALLGLVGWPVDSTWTWNQVLVFNLGFDAKGPGDVHWLYVPDPRRSFYRVGFYDNIFGAPAMSLYVELGFPREAAPDVGMIRARVLEDLRAEGIVTTQKLVAEHSVVMNPAYVHLTTRSIAEARRVKAELAARGVHSIGRYGGWTYCSIEDNIVEARELVDRLREGRDRGLTMDNGRATR